MRYLTLIFIIIVFSACGTSSTDQQTLVAYDGTLAGQLSSVYTTATVGRERLQATLERNATEIGRAAQQQRSMISTLESLGVIVQVNAITPIGPPPEAGTLEPTQNSGQAGPPRVQVTPFTPTPDATSISTQTGLSNIVTATGVDGSDCPLGVSNQFNPNTPEIYVVAVARNIQQPTTVVSRWRRAGEQIAEYSLTYEDIEEACVWFFVDQTDFEFTPGSYSVTLEVNGVALEPVVFSILG